ncbi:MAG: excinuclease ABC subunit UvrB [bacterium]
MKNIQFGLVSSYKPAGEQPQAIEKLLSGLQKGYNRQTLLGVTGSGKTFTIANVIEKWGRPTLIISHNKTLAAQLYGELRALFPKNAVEYFVSYYDYYQPEAYLPGQDIYIEKDADINDELDRLRLKATSSLLSRSDTIIVASVSCIYNIGSPDEFREGVIIITKGDRFERKELLYRLVHIQYERNEFEFKRGTFRVRGDIIDIFPSYEEEAFRIEFNVDTVNSIKVIEPITGNIMSEVYNIAIYPAKYFVMSRPRLEEAMVSIRQELKERISYFKNEGKLLEAQRLEERTLFDLEMLSETGYCKGIENYSMHLSGRKPGERPACLIDYYPDGFLTIIDESHQTIPQLHAMFNGDRSRKQTLVDYGFRLPSALENRPLRFEEFIELVGDVIFMSATPGDYELSVSKQVVEQIVRPTGLVDPQIVVKPTFGQMEDLLNEVGKVIRNGERVLVTTITKRMAERLSDWFIQMGIRARYMHSEIDTIERMEILRDLRLGRFDVLVGINLLREGLDLPEVSLVVVLDADKEGFLRDERSIIQTSGRCARNVRGKVILYAENITGSMERAVKETDRRRAKQVEYNECHNITPESIIKSVEEVMGVTRVADATVVSASGIGEFKKGLVDPVEQLLKEIEENLKKRPERNEDAKREMLIKLERMMWEAAYNERFEEAARLRDEIVKLGGPIGVGSKKKYRRKKK